MHTSHVVLVSWHPRPYCSAPGPSLLEQLDVVSSGELWIDVGERRECVNDHRDDQIEEDKAAEDLEGDEIGHGRRATAVAKLWRAVAVLRIRHGIAHDTGPSVAGEATEEPAGVGGGPNPA
eukprot:7386561-Prymnesium_polylepis.1